jgi:C-terminal processing protease CtpA/Prc
VKEDALAQKGSGGQDGGRLGLAVRQLTPAEKRDSGIDGGLVVEDVTGPAARVGIQPGDVILSLNGTPISSAEQLRALVSKSGKQVALLVQRDDARIFIRSTSAERVRRSGLRSSQHVYGTYTVNSLVPQTLARSGFPGDKTHQNRV